MVVSTLASTSRVTIPSIPDNLRRPALRLHVSPPWSRSSSTETRPRTVFVKPRPFEAPAAPEVQVKGGKGDTLWQSWLNLKPSTRLLYGITVAVIAVGGMKVSDVLQAKMPAPGEEQDQAGGKRKPKFLGFSVVDRKEA